MESMDISEMMDISMYSGSQTLREESEEKPDADQWEDAINLIKEESKEVLKIALAEQRDLELAIRFKNDITSRREVVRKQLIDFNNVHIDEESLATFTNDNCDEESLECQEALLRHHHDRLKSRNDIFQEELDRQTLIIEQLSKTRHELKDRMTEVENLDRGIKEEKNCPEFANKKLLFSTINKILNISYKNNGNTIQGVYQKNPGTFGMSKFIRKEAARPEAFDELMKEALENLRNR